MKAMAGTLMMRKKIISVTKSLLRKFPGATQQISTTLGKVLQCKVLNSE